MRLRGVSGRYLLCGGRGKVRGGEGRGGVDSGRWPVLGRDLLCGGRVRGGVDTGQDGKEN